MSDDVVEQFFFDDYGLGDENVPPQDSPDFSSAICINGETLKRIDSPANNNNGNGIENEVPFFIVETFEGSSPNSEHEVVTCYENYINGAMNHADYQDINGYISAPENPFLNANLDDYEDYHDFPENQPNTENPSLDDDDEDYHDFPENHPNTENPSLDDDDEDYHDFPEEPNTDDVNNSLVFEVFEQSADGLADDDVPQVESVSTDPTEEQPVKRGLKGKLQHTFNFTSEEQLEQLKKDNFLMSNGTMRQTKTGWRQPFTCKHKKDKCKVAATAIFMAEGQNRLEIRNTHNHELEQPQRINGIDPLTKDIVYERLHTGQTMSAMVIRSILRTKNVPEHELPSIEKIRNYTAYEKKKLYGGIFTIGQFDNVCKELSLSNESPDDKIGVVNYSIDITDEDNPRFYTLLSSKKLLNRLQSQRHIQIDGTYKILYFCHPVEIIGFTDDTHSFNACALAVVSDESGPTYSTLLELVKGDTEFIEAVADGGTGITYGFNHAMPDTFRRMCFFHVGKRVNAAMIKYRLSDEQKDVVLHGFDTMARCTDWNTFKAASAFIIQVWNEEYGLDDFSTYFKTQWVDKLPHWYNAEGSGPRTNNGQESANNLLKIAYTFRRRLSVPESFTNFRHFLQEFQSRTPGKYNPSTEDFVAARKLYCEKRSAAKIGERYYIPSAKCNLDQNELASLIRNYISASPSYETIVTFQKQVYLVCRSKVYERRYWCSCPRYLERHSCKHSLMYEIKDGIFEWPANIQYHTVPLGGRRPPGRPRLARHALSRD